MEVTRTEFNELKEDVRKILSYLENDERTGSEGYIAVTRRLSLDLEQIKQEEKVRKSVAGAWGIFGGIIVVLVNWLINIINAIIQ